MHPDIVIWQVQGRSGSGSCGEAGVHIAKRNYLLKNGEKEGEKKMNKDVAKSGVAREHTLSQPEVSESKPRRISQGSHSFGGGGTGGE